MTGEAGHDDTAAIRVGPICSRHSGFMHRAVCGGCYCEMQNEIARLRRENECLREQIAAPIAVELAREIARAAVEHYAKRNPIAFSGLSRNAGRFRKWGRKKT